MVGIPSVFHPQTQGLGIMPTISSLPPTIVGFYLTGYFCHCEAMCSLLANFTGVGGCRHGFEMGTQQHLWRVSLSISVVFLKSFLHSVFHRDYACVNDSTINKAQVKLILYFSGIKVH